MIAGGAVRNGLAAVVLLAPLALSEAARAEYRVALLIGGGEAAGLEGQGFRCEATPNLSQKELIRTIEGWASTTPTLSTAVVWFGGEVRDRALVAGDGRPVPIAAIADSLASRGGSARNVLVLPGRRAGAAAPDFSPGCEVVSASPRFAGVASRAISPPGVFVPGKSAGDEWVNARGMVFCWCPPGRYVAGSPEGTPGRHPDEALREVVIGEGFWIGKFEHTRGQKLRNLSNRMIGTHKNEPVNHLHWDDGSRMVTRTLSDAERAAGRLPEGWEYSLPTEDQWEYAARAGTTTRYYFGDEMRALPRHANFADKSFYDSGDIYSNHAHRTLDDGFARLAPVGSFAPNPWGLHDVYGNVVEWCIDKAARGGGWVSLGENCRSAYRDSYASRDEQPYLGYRFVIQRRRPGE